jgi:hypothetical protein
MMTPKSKNFFKFPMLKISNEFVSFELFKNSELTKYMIITISI